MDAWIGLVNVIPLPRNNDLLGAKGAYVNVIALASNKNDFQAVVNTELSAHKFHVVSIEDVERLTDRVKLSSLDKELSAIADNVKRTGNIGFGVFHAYQEDETLS